VPRIADKERTAFDDADLKRQMDTPRALPGSVSVPSVEEVLKHQPERAKGRR
jgi:hypothetical protein